MKYGPKCNLMLLVMLESRNVCFPDSTCWLSVSRTWFKLIHLRLLVAALPSITAASRCLQRAPKGGDGFKAQLQTILGATRAPVNGTCSAAGEVERYVDGWLGEGGLLTRERFSGVPCALEERFQPRTTQNILGRGLHDR